MLRVSNPVVRRAACGCYPRGSQPALRAWHVCLIGAAVFPRLGGGGDPGLRFCSPLIETAAVPKQQQLCVVALAEVPWSLTAACGRSATKGFV